MLRPSDALLHDVAWPACWPRVRPSSLPQILKHGWDPLPQVDFAPLGRAAPKRVLWWEHENKLPALFRNYDRPTDRQAGLSRNFISNSNVQLYRLFRTYVHPYLSLIPFSLSQPLYLSPELIGSYYHFRNEERGLIQLRDALGHLKWCPFTINIDLLSIVSCLKLNCRWGRGLKVVSLSIYLRGLFWLNVESGVQRISE